jgi:hypothetical protein
MVGSRGVFVNISPTGRNCLGLTAARLGAKIAPIGLAPPVLTLKQHLTGLVALGPDRMLRPYIKD